MRREKNLQHVFLHVKLQVQEPMVVSSFVGREQGVALVQEYDIWFLYHMLVKCHEHLHPIIDS
jgi:hypothetical protein